MTFNMPGRRQAGGHEANPVAEAIDYESWLIYTAAEFSTTVGIRQRIHTARSAAACRSMSRPQQAPGVVALTSWWGGARERRVVGVWGVYSGHASLCAEVGAHPGVCRMMRVM